ncbi:HAD family hydrolase [Metabacillus sediminilitoris]|uniref:HAD family hydrolase n=1 Tax=Metabacillus sediminilitoris TaxID=2567941 RepID=A0A4V3WFQ6_9BACI|nr:HAD family hydrolase [Metabacillus sediminilitoris]QGQ47784.1 HAD-IA family hydrolase [Metabacillus sediminilitoris]THF81103.1 HAD family hydrolase [Metabacillus sediminilitoris]
MIDSIIFDLDGTLWDTTHIGAQFWSEAASNYHLPVQVTGDQLKGLYGLPVDIIAKKLFPDAAKEVLQAIMRESSEKQCQYLEKEGGILFPRLLETLNELKKNYRLFIVSNCEEGYIQSFIKVNQLEGYFEDFEYPGRTGLSKADNIRIVIDRNQLNNPVYVGDTALDAASAKEADIPFVYARYGFGHVEKFDDVIDSLNELNQLSLLKD